MPRCPPDRQKRPQEPPRAVGVQEYHPQRKSRPEGRTGRTAGRPAQDSRSGYSFTEGQQGMEKPRRSRQALPGVGMVIWWNLVSPQGLSALLGEFQKLLSALLRFLEVPALPLLAVLPLHR